MIDNNTVAGLGSFAGWIKSLAAVVLGLSFASQAFGQANITTLNFELVSSGLDRPVFATSAPDDSNSLFVLEQHFVTLPSGTLSTRNEQGLLGLAFAPDYQTSGRYYLNYTDAAGDTRVREYTRQSPTQGNPIATRDILRVDQPFTNHNAGWIGFGPDGNLYIATGDGGSANDPGNNSQTITNNLLGKILRVSVDGDDFPNDTSRNYSVPSSNPFVGQTGDDEIFAYGLRNPYRCSFDRITGDLWIGDVGQNAREETGGYVYRGSIPELDGHYFFADFVNNRLWSFVFDEAEQAEFDGTNFTNFIDWSDRIENGLEGGAAGEISNISSFGEDNDGDLLVVSLDGNVFRLDSVTTLGDVNRDGVVDFLDISPFVTVLSTGGSQAEADIDGDGDVSFFDISPFIDILSQ